MDFNLYSVTKNYIGTFSDTREEYSDAVLNSTDVLNMIVMHSDLLFDKVETDQEIRFDNRVYIIRKVYPIRTEQGEYYKKVEAESNFTELAGYIYPDITVVDMTVKDGLTFLLRYSSWQTGTIEGADASVHSLQEKDNSMLAAVRKWALVCGYEIEFDEPNRLVNFKRKIGVERAETIEYKKNMIGIEKIEEAPTMTGIRPEGKEGLNIEAVNDGNPWIENYAYYTSKGLDYETARQHYRRHYIYRNEAFLDANDLKREGQKILDEYAKPSFTYQIKLLDIDPNDQSKFNIYNIGDTVHVIDNELGINDTVRVVRKKTYYREPWRNEIELGTQRQGLESSMSQTPSTSEKAPAGGCTTQGEKYRFMQFWMNNFVDKFLKREDLTGKEDFLAGLLVKFDESETSQKYTDIMDIPAYGFVDKINGSSVMLNFDVHITNYAQAVTTKAKFILVIKSNYSEGMAIREFIFDVGATGTDKPFELFKQFQIPIFYDDHYENIVFFEVDNTSAKVSCDAEVFLQKTDSQKVELEPLLIGELYDRFPLYIM